ncbi:amidohydrolase family protein [delta proteobacterium NaphS2]|nr:amidohydrolase family protein [delta proteobacterium NaphS2]
MKSINSKPSETKNVDLVIQGGTAVTMVPGQAPVPNARILIKKDRIVQIGPSTEIPLPHGSALDIIDAQNGIIMPGLVNAHAHTAMALFRGFADDLPLRTWLFDKIFPAEADFLSPETVYWGALMGCIEMITSGTTCVADGYFFQDATIRAVDKCGIRAVVAQGVIDFPAPGIPDPKKNIRTARDFLEKWQHFSERITPGLFCHSPVTCSEKTLLRSQQLSKDYDKPLQIHLSETSAEVAEIIKRTGKRPTHYLDQLDLVDNQLIAAHGVYLDKSEIRCLHKKGAGIIHVPESNMKLSSGIAPLADILAMGVRTGLGTDGCASNNNLDLFGEMDTAAKLSKVSTGRPDATSATQVLEMATIGGAAALGLEKETGTLEKGKKADIIVVDTRAPHLCPLYNPVSVLVYAACGADVKDVVVDGTTLMKERKLCFLDPNEIMARVGEISEKIRR